MERHHLKESIRVARTGLEPLPRLPFQIAQATRRRPFGTVGPVAVVWTRRPLRTRPGRTALCCRKRCNAQRLPRTDAQDDDATLRVVVWNDDATLRVVVWKVDATLRVVVWKVDATLRVAWMTMRKMKMSTPGQTPAPMRRINVPAPKAVSEWRPEPCPLTREELRRIILEQLG